VLQLSLSHKGGPITIYRFGQSGFTIVDFDLFIYEDLEKLIFGILFLNLVHILLLSQDEDDEDEGASSSS